MAKYRKKLVGVEAEQWFKVTYDKGTQYEKHLGVGYYRTPEGDGQDKCKYCGDIMHNHGWIDVGGLIVCPGDFVFLNANPSVPLIPVSGSPYPCKPDIFEATYEKV